MPIISSDYLIRSGENICFVLLEIPLLSIWPYTNYIFVFALSKHIWVAVPLTQIHGWPGFPHRTPHRPHHAPTAPPSHDGGRP